MFKRIALPLLTLTAALAFAAPRADARVRVGAAVNVGAPAYAAPAYAAPVYAAQGYANQGYADPNCAPNTGYANSYYGAPAYVAPAPVYVNSYAGYGYRAPQRVVVERGWERPREPQRFDRGHEQSQRGFRR